MPASIEAEEVAAAHRWERLAAEHPELAPAIDFQRRALAALRRAAPCAALPRTDAGRTRACLLEGVPLLAAAEPRFVERPPFGLLSELARLARRAFDPQGARTVERIARRRADAAGAGLESALRRDMAVLSTLAEDLGIPPHLFATLCELAVSPSLQALTETAGPLLRAIAWDRGYCPLCGSWPLFGELRDAGRNRHLRCGLCGADWGFARLACPFCGESTHRRLQAIHVEGEADYLRAEVCDTCRGYVKSLARLSPTPARLLPVEDLATAYLDLLALDAGYRRPEKPPAFGARARREEG